MPRDDSERGVAAWCRRWWRAMLSELVATALLVLLGVASLLPLVDALPLTHPALGFGFVIIGNIHFFGPVSGAHMNPAVTLAAVLYGQLPVAAAAGYFVAQVAGAIMGFALLLFIAPSAVTATAVGVTLPGPGVSPVGAMLMEAVMTGVLVLVCCGVWSSHDARKPDHAAGLKLGLTVAGLVYCGGFLTGTSINPARSFAPALLQCTWTHHWVYWVGPLGGAVLAALLGRLLLVQAAPVAAQRPEDLPLHDKPDH